MTIYFDENKEAYSQIETLKRWHKKLIYQCSNEEYKEFLQGKRIWQDNLLIVNVNYEKEQQEKEQQRINSLIVTRVELETAIYKVYKVTLKDIQEKLKGNLPENILVGITEMNIAFNANEFRRDNPYINLLCYILKISEQNMNQFFETKNFTCLKG